MLVVQDTVRCGEVARPLATASNRRRILPFVRGHAFALTAVAIVLLAAVLRLWRLDMAEFKGDELQVTQLAFQLALHGTWPDRGILSSLGTYNSPLFIYLEALPALFWASPLALTALVAVLNVVAVAVAIVFARRYFGPTPALVAGLLFATAPWAVVYSRKIWEQDALPPVALLFFVALFAVVVDRKPRALLLCGLAAGVAIQLHPSAVVLPLIAFGALLLWPRRFPWTSVVAAIALAVLTLLPYFHAEWQHSFADWHSAFGGDTHTHLGPALGLLVSLLNWAESVSGWQVLGMFTAGGAGYRDPGYVVLADLVIWGLLVGAAVHLAVRWRRGGPLSGFRVPSGCSPPVLMESESQGIGCLSQPPRLDQGPGTEPFVSARPSPPRLEPSRPEGTQSSTWARSRDSARPPQRTPAHRGERSAQIAMLLTLWLFVPPLLFGLSGLLTFPHYFIAAYPAPFLSIGVFVEAISTGSQWRRIAALTAVAALVLGNVATVSQVLLAPDRSPFPNDYGLPLAFDTAAAGAIAQDAGGRPYAIRVDAAFRDGQQVVDQVVAWKSRPANHEAPLQYWVLPAGVLPPSPAHLLLPLGPSLGAPVANIWAGTDAEGMGNPDEPMPGIRPLQHPESGGR